VPAFARPPRMAPRLTGDYIALPTAGLDKPNWEYDANA
jgi:hypothetical protein